MRIVTYFSIFLFCSYSSLGQIPFIVSLQAHPTVISDVDSVYLIAAVGMNTAPTSLVSYSVLNTGNDFTVDGCYSGGMMTAFMERVDTFNLGLMTPGTHHLIIFARGGFCDSTWTSTDTVTIEVGFNSIEEDIASKVLLFPNPTSTGFLEIFPKNKFTNWSYEIYDFVGRTVKAGIIPETGLLDVSELNGIYILHLDNGVVQYNLKFLVK